MKKIVIFAICIFSGCHAFAADKSSAESVLLKYLQAMKSYDTSLMTNLMHPDALQKFRAPIDAALSGKKWELATTELLPLFSVSSVREFMDLSTPETYKRMNDTLAKSAPKIIEAIMNSEHEVVGSIVKNDTAYITYILKLPIEGRSVSREAVQKLKLHNDEWLLMLPSDGEATIAQIESRYGK